MSEIFTNEPEFKLKVSFKEDFGAYHFTDMDAYYCSMDKDFASLEVPMFELEILRDTVLNAIAHRDEYFGENGEQK